MKRTYILTKILLIFIFSFNVIAGESLSGMFYFTQYVVYKENSAEEKAEEGVLYVSRNTFTKKEIEEIKKIYVIENASNEWLDSYYADKNVCIATTPKAPSAREITFSPTITKSRKGTDKIHIQVQKWPDWSYGFSLENKNETLELKGFGGQRGYGYISERFEITRIANLGIKTCLSLIEAGNNIYWPDSKVTASVNKSMLNDSLTLATN